MLVFSLLTSNVLLVSLFYLIHGFNLSISNLDINTKKDTGLEIDINLVHNPPQNYKWTFVGRLLGIGNVMFESFQQLMASFWRPVKGVHIRDLGQGRYWFQFFHELDMARMLSYGPWTFENRLLITIEVSPSDNVHTMPLNIMQIWVQVLDFPSGFVRENKCFDWQ